MMATCLEPPGDRHTPPTNTKNTSTAPPKGAHIPPPLKGGKKNKYIHDVYVRARKRPHIYKCRPASPQRHHCDAHHTKTSQNGYKTGHQPPQLPHKCRQN